MKKVLFLLIMATALFACEDDEKIVPKDYGTKTFKADLKYTPKTPHGQIAYKQQTFLKLGKSESVHVGNYGKDTWTAFNLNKEDADNKYNVTTDVKGWDLVFTHYTDLIVGMGGKKQPYGVTGVLINTSQNIQIGMYEYTAKTDMESIKKAFADLKIADIPASTKYSTAINAIGHDWKTFIFKERTYKIHTNKFYIVKLADNNIYKFRFVSFYGDTKDDRVVTIEYALMK